MFWRNVKIKSWSGKEIYRNLEKDSKSTTQQFASVCNVSAEVGIFNRMSNMLISVVGKTNIQTQTNEEYEGSRLKKQAFFFKENTSLKTKQIERNISYTYQTHTRKTSSRLKFFI